MPSPRSGKGFDFAHFPSATGDVLLALQCSPLPALVRVAAVHEIAADRRGEVRANRTGRGAKRIGRAHDLPAACDGIFAFDRHCDKWSAGNEINQTLKKRLAFVLGIMLARPIAVQLHELHRDYQVAASLQARDNFTG